MSTAREALADLIAEGMADRGNYISEWPEDEAKAYRKKGWAEGRADARALQVAKTVDAILSAFPGIRETIEGEVTARIEWGNEYILKPGEYQREMRELDARSSAEAFPDYRRLVKRTVLYGPWEVCDE